MISWRCHLTSIFRPTEDSLRPLRPVGVDFFALPLLSLMVTSPLRDLVVRVMLVDEQPRFVADTQYTTQICRRLGYRLPWIRELELPRGALGDARSNE